MLKCGAGRLRVVSTSLSLMLLLSLSLLLLLSLFNNSNNNKNQQNNNNNNSNNKNNKDKNRLLVCQLLSISRATVETWGRLKLFCCKGCCLCLLMLLAMSVVVVIVIVLLLLMSCWQDCTSVENGQCGEQVGQAHDVSDRHHRHRHDKAKSCQQP